MAGCIVAGEAGAIQRCNSPENSGSCKATSWPRKNPTFQLANSTKSITFNLCTADHCAQDFKYWNHGDSTR